jgi:hypothetical protein
MEIILRIWHVPHGFDDFLMKSMNGDVFRQKFIYAKQQLPYFCSVLTEGNSIRR